MATWPILPACCLYLKGTWEEGTWALGKFYCSGSLYTSCGPQVAHPVIKLRLCKQLAAAGVEISGGSVKVLYELFGVSCLLILACGDQWNGL